MASCITLTGERPIGKWERLCRERFDLDLATGKERGLIYDEEEARAAVSFFAKYCRHHKGEWAGRPLVLADWQAQNIGQMFGWRHEETGYRRFRTAWWETPKKNGKTQIAGGVGLRLLVADGEQGGEVYFTATKRDQALLGYRAACHMALRSPLRHQIRIPKGFLHGAAVVSDRLGAMMQPLSSDYSTLDGPSPSGDIRDEIHEWKDAGLAAVLDGAAAARRQPLTLEITTAGVYDQHGVGWTRHEYACQVLDGSFNDDAQFAFIAAADEGDDPFDPATWWKANPNLGISPKLDFIAGRAKKAQRAPHLLNDFLRYHLNVWTRQVTRWLPLDRWKEGDPRTLSPVQYAAWTDTLAGRECYGGLDLATKLDLASFILEFPHEDGSVDLLARFWLPEGTVERHALEGRKHFALWSDQGWLKTTPGDVIDYDFIRAEVVELAKKFRIQQVAYDPWGATHISTQLRGDGVDMIECGQGYKSMSEPSKDFEARVTNRQVRHGGHPILKWCAGNAVVRKDPAGNIKPDKEKAKDKIDGIVAAIMARSCSVRGGGPSVYETRGFLSL